MKYSKWLLIFTIINIFPLLYSIDDCILRRIKGINNSTEWADPLYLEQNFITPQMRELIADYRDWLAGRKDTPTLWMGFLKDVALKKEKYHLIENEVEKEKVRSAISDLIKRVKGIGESKWQSGLPDSDKFGFVEEAALKYEVEDESHKLLLYRSLKHGFRIWSWEDLAANKDPSVTEKVEDFMEKLKILKLDSFYLKDRIQGLWELRWIYTNTNLSDNIRLKALDMIFEKLDERIGDIHQGKFAQTEELWRNAREILRELFTAKKWNGIDYIPDERIWKPALERALESISNSGNVSNPYYVELDSPSSRQYEFWSWWAITDALGSVNIDDNPRLFEELSESGNPEIIRHVLSSKLMYIKPIRQERLRDRIISNFVQNFKQEDDEAWIEVWGETLMKIGSPKIVNEILRIVQDKTAPEDKRNWALRIIGETYYQERNKLLYKMRDALFEIALNEGSSKLKNTALRAIFSMRGFLKRRGIKFSPSGIRITEDELNNFKETLKSNVPKDERFVMFSQELEKIEGIRLSSYQDVIDYIDSATSPQIFSAILKALVASNGATTTMNSFINSRNYKNDIAEIEKITETPFEYLLGYNWLRRSDKYQWIDPKMNAEFSSDGKLIVDGKQFATIGYPRDIDGRPTEIFESRDGEKMMVKGGSELAVICEYIAQRFYAEFIKNKWGKYAGIGVAPMALVKDPRDGKLKLVTKMVANYKKGTKYLPPQYMRDERLQSIIGAALTLGDGKRTSKSMLFLQRDFDKPVDEYDNNPDYLLFNFGSSLLYSDGDGFEPYRPQFMVTGNFDEFDYLTHSSHTGMRDYVNYAWKELINGEDASKLEAFLSDTQSLVGLEVDTIINDIFNEIALLLGYEYGEKTTIESWISQIKSEKEFGRWNLEKKAVRGWLIDIFEEIIAIRDLRFYLMKALGQRSNDVMKFLTYIRR